MSEQRAPEDTAEGMLLARCSQGTREPDIGAEDFLQHLGMDAVIALRPLADRKKSHIAETIVRDPNAHMSHAFGVTAQLDSQAVRSLQRFASFCIGSQSKTDFLLRCCPNNNGAATCIT